VEILSAMETVTDTRPTFSRLTEGKTRHSWRAAAPAVVVIVLAVALVGYLASSVSSSSQRASAAERDANQYRDQVAAMGKQVGDLQKDVALLRSPGRTTVILQAAAPTGKKGAAPASKTWATAIWGELPNGKTWMRANAYGLSEDIGSGKAYHVWLQPQSGDPVDVGAVEADPNGDGFAMKTDLPAIDQGKAVMLTIDASDAKQPGETVARADLPKLEPRMQAAPQQAQEQGQAPAKPDQAQGKSGTESQQMHKAGK
jgi:Anti-sigma-K factor rskA